MKIVSILAPLMLVCGHLVGCIDSPTRGGSLRIDVDTVATTEVTLPQDPLLTYEYTSAGANSDSLLRALWSDGVQIHRGFDALDYFCMDARGPRFVVELRRDDLRMASYGFVKGKGGLGCAARLKRYTLVY